MRIGYACLGIMAWDHGFRRVLAKNASDDNLRQAIADNLRSLDELLEYNHQHNIRMFRLSSDIIPFGSSSINALPWWDEFASELAFLATKIKEYDIRISLHPGQYTVLNSLRNEVVDAAVKDLIYHTRLLEALGGNSQNKIILHLGGVYGDKQAAIERFCFNYRKLPANVRDHLIIENDDRHYTASDIYQIAVAEGIPFVFDNLHHELNHEENSPNMKTWIKHAATTWKDKDGTPKLHYSDEDQHKRQGAHATSIDINNFAVFVSQLPSDNFDIMLEIKDKNLSAVKAINYLNKHGQIRDLEIEWAHYKYAVMEHSYAAVKRISRLLQNKKDYPVLSFYEEIEAALALPIKKGSALNAYQHVVGYLKKSASIKEYQNLMKRGELVKQNLLSLAAAKRYLYKLAQQYNVDYLCQSLYFAI